MVRIIVTASLCMCLYIEKRRFCFLNKRNNGEIMSAEQYVPSPSGNNEDRRVMNSQNGNTVAGVNSSQSTQVSGNKNGSKAKHSKKDENVLYITIEEEDEPMHIKMKRVIPKIIDEYVSTYKKPIRRKKLQDLVFGYDEKLAKFYQEHKEAAVAVFSFALSKLLREKKIVRVKDPDKKRPTYYILPKHVSMFKKEA